MNEGERHHEARESNHEYSFEDGLKETLQRITNLLSSQDYVVVTVHGSPNAGKTFFSGQLGQALTRQGIETLWISSDIDALNRAPAGYFESKGVVLVGATSSGGPTPKSMLDTVLRGENETVRQQGEKAGLSLKGIDIRVAIYSPRNPFSLREEEVMTADIIIRNDDATVK